MQNRKYFFAGEFAEEINWGSKRAKSRSLDCVRQRRTSLGMTIQAGAWGISTERDQFYVQKRVKSVADGSMSNRSCSVLQVVPSMRVNAAWPRIDGASIRDGAFSPSRCIFIRHPLPAVGSARKSIPPNFVGVFFSTKGFRGASSTAVTPSIRRSVSMSSSTSM
jgi:hypothetical protein